MTSFGTGPDVLTALERQRRAAERASAETEVFLRLARAVSRSETPADIYEPALDAVRDFAGADVPVHVGDARGTIARSTTT